MSLLDDIIFRSTYLLSIMTYHDHDHALSGDREDEAMEYVDREYYV